MHCRSCCLSDCHFFLERLANALDCTAGPNLRERNCSGWTKGGLYFSTCTLTVARLYPYYLRRDYHPLLSPTLFQSPNRWASTAQAYRFLVLFLSAVCLSRCGLCLLCSCQVLSFCLPLSGPCFPFVYASERCMASPPLRPF